MLALGFFSVLEFREGKEQGPVGFRPPGAPSKNPATACKAEKKKRGEGARTLRKSDLPAGSLFDDDGASLQHESCIAADNFQGKRGASKKASAGASTRLRICQMQLQHPHERNPD
jgi:hypothetical protein